MWVKPWSRWAYPVGKRVVRRSLSTVCPIGLSTGQAQREGRSRSDHPHIHGSGVLVEVTIERAHPLTSFSETRVPNPMPCLSSQSQKACVRIFAFIGLFIGFLLVAFGSAASATVSLSAGILLLLLCEVEKFDFLKGFGFEAKVREFNQTIDRAEEIVTQLRSLALATARNIITLVSSTDGYTETYSRKTAWDMVESVRNSLIELNIDQFEIDEVVRPYDVQVAEHLLQLFEASSATFQNQLRMFHAAAVSFNDLRSARSLDPDPTKWRDIAQRVATYRASHPDPAETCEQETLERAEDLAAWKSRRELRRPDVYFREG